MRIAILIFDDLNEIDSFVAFHILNRMRTHGWRAEIVGPTHTVTSASVEPWRRSAGPRSFATLKLVNASACRTTRSMGCHGDNPLMNTANAYL